MISGKKILQKILPIFILLAVTMNLCTVVHAGTVVIKPGRFDHFMLQMPEKAIAGENFVITVSAYDANKNLITNFAETGKEFRIDVGGSAIAKPSVIGAASFSGGLANVVINDRKAEKITFSIREAGGSVPVVSREITVTANKPDRFVVQSASSVVAGASFEVKLAARDAYDNPVQDLDIARNIKITSTGTSAVKILGNDMLDFKGGVASAHFVAEKVGDVAIDFVDIASGNRGKTQNIHVGNAGLAYFKLQAPRSAVAGEPIELLITAYDAFENIVANYASSNSGVKLSASGSSKVEPSTVNASEFKNGQAVVKVTYDKAESIEIAAREINRDHAGRSSEIAVANTTADHFVVTTPDAAMSGQKFKIRIEAFDRFNNSVRNFNASGGDVYLGSSGTGSLSPSRIVPSEFANGLAVVEVMYDKAESFQITAGLSSDRSAFRADSNVRREISRVPSAPKKDSKKSVHVEEPIKSETGKTKQAKKAEPKKQKAEEKKSAAKPEKKSEAAKAVERPAEAKPIESKPVQAKPAQPVKETVKPAEAKPEKKMEKKAVEAPKTETSPKGSVEVAKRDEKKAEKNLYNVSKISIIESKNKAMLVVNITSPNGNLVYGDEIETRHSKEWLKLRIKPAISSTDKSFKFKSAYIGEVMVEEDKTAGQNQVVVYVELLPSGITYDIARVKNTLVVTLSNP